MMPRALPRICLVLLLAGCRATAGTETASGPPAAQAVLPAPQEVVLSGGSFSLPTTLRCRAEQTELDPLLGVLDHEYRMLTGGRVAGAAGATGAACRLSLDPALGEQEYRLTVGDEIRLAGGSYAAVAMGSATLLQMVERGGDGFHLPRISITDRPDRPYRGLLIDVARNWHDVSVLEQLIVLARWYKISHLQLHLTDDQLFTFPTESYPELPTPGKHYTQEELRRLDEFARVRGVVLVPELEVPGHAGQMIRRRPDLFGGVGWPENAGAINMGREAAYEALDRIVGEIAEVFRTSPYIHISGDEARLEHLASDPEVRRYLAEHDLDSLDELYRHFLVRMNEIVKRHGKRTLVWEGFGPEGDVEIPRDVLVLAWETIYQLPQDLLEGGYTIVNASWKPLYVVNDRKWPVEYIYGEWNLWRWENWVPKMPSFTPIQLAPHPGVIGASMSAWAQPQHLELPTLRRRVAAMSERTWNATVEPERPLSWFLPALERTDSLLQEVLTPIRIRERGVYDPTIEEGQYNEQFWFDDALTLMLSADSGLVIHYSRDGSEPTPRSPRYTGPVVLRESTPFRARAFTPAGGPVGYTLWREYELHPLRAQIQGWTGTPPGEVWELLDKRVAFTDSLVVTLSSGRPGPIRYTVDGTAPSRESPVYRGPIRLRASAVVRAQLFDAAGAPVGHPWVGRFRRAEG